MNKKIMPFVFAVLLIAAIGGAIYGLARREANAPQDGSFGITDYPPGLFELNVMKDNIPQEKLDSWKTRFGNDTSTVLSAPDGFHFASILDMGLIKRNVGDFRGAEEAWVYLGEKRPLNSISFYNLGALYAHDLKDAAKSEKAYLKAIENEKHDINYFVGLAELYRYQIPEKSGQAADILEDGVRENPEDANMLKFAASYYAETGDPSRAIELYRQVLELEPGNDAVREEIRKLEHVNE